jgi:pimeloyl-ACP methyl ester carboxylesterase
MAETDKGISAQVPGANPDIEECRMDLQGARMRYLRAGSGPALILLHGMLGYSFSWRFTMPALAPYATIYAPDMLGAGFSDRAPGLDHGMSATARRLLQFAEQLSLSQFDLLGTSHGGAVAICAAAQSLSDRKLPQVRRLVLVAPVNPYSAHGKRIAPFFGSRLGAAIFRVTTPRVPFLYSYIHQRMYGSRHRIPAGALEGYMAPLAMPGLFEHALAIVRTWTADLRELETILPTLASIPTLFMWGRNDIAVYPSSAAPLARHFSNSKTVTFPGIGHLPYEECPDDFNRELIQFLTYEKIPS